MSGLPSDLDSVVRSKFTIKDTFQLPDGEVEYKVEYVGSSKMNFVELQKELSGVGYLPRLVGTREEATLFVRKKPAPPQSKSRVPVISALLTFTSVLLFALLEGIVYGQFAPGLPGIYVPFTYGATVVLLLGVHEFGHWYLARRSGSSPPTAYAIPGFPGVTAFLPALGFVSLQKEPSVNRDTFFDLVLVGPFLALAVAAALYVAGAFVSVQSSVPLQGGQLASSYISVRQINPSLIQLALDSVLGPFSPYVAPGFVRLSPLQDGATVGFLLTFIGLLPMASFDGGRLSSVVLRPAASRVATYLSAFALIILDTPNYGALAIVVLLVAVLPANPQLLDEVSRIASNRRWLYMGALLVAFSSLPIPQNLATFPLG